MSIIYINNLTAVDCAIELSNVHLGVENPISKIVGFSFNVSVEIEGTPTKQEKVIADFGTAKKLIKNIIDGEFGPDHKLIVAKDGMFNPEVVNTPENAIYRCGEKLSHTLWNFDFNSTDNFLPIPVYYGDASQIQDSFSPLVAYTYLPKEYQNFLELMEEELLNLLNEKFKAHDLGDIKISSVSCDCVPSRPPKSIKDMISENSKSAWATAYLSYTHGLKDSTSYGCKNICHGHLSYIMFEISRENTEVNSKVIPAITKIMDKLKHCRFIFRDNINEDGSEEYTCERGTFTADPMSDIFGEVIILNTESTVEFLSEYIRTTHGKELKRVGVLSVYISEGLHKGSFIRF